MRHGRPAAKPAGPEARVQSLDILRGLALAGMFVVHFHVRSSDPGGIDEIVRQVVWRGVETKSHGTFALLFGAGFALQLARAERSGKPFAGVYLRRLLVLAGFGFAAHALFGFNVLLSYAVWGLPLLLIRSWSTRALVLVAVLSAGSVPIYRITEAAYLTATAGPDAIGAAAAAESARAARVTGALRAAGAGESYGALLQARLAHMAWFYTQPFFITPGPTFTLFIAGLLMIRHRVFENVRPHARAMTGLAAFGLFSWITCNWLLPNTSPFGLLRDQWLTFTYVCAALWMLDRRPSLLEPLRPVAAAGRMALTNYLVQIAALDVLFSGYALGLGEIRPVYGLGAALACFAAEVVTSVWWLKRFRFGPAEWLWRSLTYGRAQPMRRIVSPVHEQVVIP